MSNAIILNRFTRIGDRVVMQMDSESRAYNSTAPANGSVGTIIGYSSWIDYKCYNEPYGKPGRYHRWSAPVIKWDGIENLTGASLHDICFVDAALKASRRDDPGNATVEAEVYLGPLPETLYLPDDVVRVRGQSRTWNAENGDHVRISKVRYNDLKEKRADGSAMPIYDGTYAYKLSGYTWYHANEIAELVKRGNYYHWFKGDKANLEFDSLEKEISFYRSIGRVKEVRNPDRDLYIWTLDEALRAILNNEADVFSMSSGLFGSGPSLRVSRIIDMPELAERSRAAIKAGFADEVARLSAPEKV